MSAQNTTEKNAENWCVYLILCANGALYCGISNRPAERFAAHAAGKGAKYTRLNKPLAMRIAVHGLNKSAALKREIEVKKMSAENKRALWTTLADFAAEAV
ncbi:GIY-YIG nuclease family protein [Neisseria chenwenguii]|uniref:Uncharacterized protein n=1 Tax=Neisseria chenwenguii TaxID=1853278 RepID=A0A220S0R0_9NEIS|nr:GIY-YIG nuclease family protein [Neisseria chenwenguii]ASK26992.1 hypothetical protein BG910_03885 [Neisseria chenwenguii]ROV56107.1 GIY-YIG nuclease family protein [Neisseria chenwenguii]